MQIAPAFAIRLDRIKILSSYGSYNKNISDAFELTLYRQSSYA
jgi:hypothetical protein